MPLPLFLSFPPGICFCLCMCTGFKVPQGLSLGSHPTSKQRALAPGVYLPWPSHPSEGPQCHSSESASSVGRAHPPTRPKNKSPKPPAKTAQNPRVNPPPLPQSHKTLATTADFSPHALAYLPPPNPYNRTNPPSPDLGRRAPLSAKAPKTSLTSMGARLYPQSLRLPYFAAKKELTPGDTLASNPLG